MQPKSFRKIACGAVAVLAFLAGCSSNSKTSIGANSGGSAAVPGSSAAPTGTPIVVGNIGSYTGANASSNGVAQPVIKAWAQWVNAHGGIQGHPVQLIVKDDATDPATAATQIQELIDAKVSAIVGDFSNVDTSWAKTITAAGIPVVGGIASSPPFITNPDFFPSGPGGALPYGLAATAKTYGDKTSVIYCSESAGCKGVSDIIGLLSAQLKLTVSYTAALSSTSADLTATCLALASSGATSAVIAVPGATGVKLIQTCDQQGVKVQYIFADGAANKSVADQLKNFIDVDTVFPYYSDSTPTRKAFQDAVTKYAPNVSSTMGPQAAVAWESGVLFQAAVEAAIKGGATDITAVTVKDGLYALPKDFEADGTAPRVNFTKDTPQPTPVACWYLWGKKDGKSYSPNPEIACGPQADIVALQKTVYKY